MNEGHHSTLRTEPRPEGSGFGAALLPIEEPLRSGCGSVLHRFSRVFPERYT